MNNQLKKTVNQIKMEIKRYHNKISLATTTCLEQKTQKLIHQHK